jgi:hypothetical protein
MGGRNPLVIGPFSNDRGPIWFSKMIILDGIIGDRVGQLGKSGEYKTGRLRVVWIVNSELQDGSPLLCRLRPALVGSE